jgi:4-amino-4-deoxy-L-arabinose transferase-like glycosyltransferase
VPLPLGLLLVAATLLSLAWIVLMPPLQGPDEVSHFTYTQRIYEKHTIPWKPRGGTTGNSGPYSPEVRTALSEAGFGPLAANTGARPLWTRADERVWSDTARGINRSLGGYTSALKNPPVYYLYQVVPYAVGTGGSFFDRELLMRIANVPLLLVGLTFVWLLAGEVFGRRRDMQLLATAVVAFIPQLSNVTATVNPDIALVAEWSAALYVMALILRRGIATRLIVWLAVLNALALLTQPRSVTLLIPSALTVLLAVARERAWRRISPLRVGAATGGVFLLVTLLWAGLGQGSIREFGSYLWQFYLPKLGFMNNTIGPIDYDVRKGMVERLFGSFAQLEITLPPNIDDIVWWAARLALVAIVVALVIRRGAIRRNAGLAVVFATALVTLLLGLHLVAYRTMVGNPGDPIITARYVLPLLALLGIAVAIVADVLPRPFRNAFTGLVLAGGVAIQLLSLGLVLGRFYG